MNQLLTNEQIKHSMLGVGKNWQQSNDTLISEFKFKNYQECLIFVNKVAELCQKHNHHADICFGWNYCKISLTTHYLKGLTQLDFNLAQEINVIN